MKVLLDMNLSPALVQEFALVHGRGPDSNPVPLNREDHPGE